MIGTPKIGKQKDDLTQPASLISGQISIGDDNKSFNLNLQRPPLPKRSRVAQADISARTIDHNSDGTIFIQTETPRM